MSSPKAAPTPLGVTLLICCMVPLLVTSLPPLRQANAESPPVADTVTGQPPPLASEAAAVEGAGGGPHILHHPHNTRAIEGSVVTFAVEGRGEGPLHYQWMRNGRPILGATSAQFHLPVTAADDGALFSAVVAGAHGRTWSQSARLNVTLP